MQISYATCCTVLSNTCLDFILGWSTKLKSKDLQPVVNLRNWCKLCHFMFDNEVKSGKTNHRIISLADTF